MVSIAKTLEHVGEWRVALQADARAELFAAMARVVADAAGPVDGESGPWEPVAIDATDCATLLVDWANELIGRSEVEGRGYAEVRRLTIAEDGRLRLAAEIRGRPVREWSSPLKAATYHGALVERSGDGWRAEVLFDV